MKKEIKVGTIIIYKYIEGRFVRPTESNFGDGCSKCCFRDFHNSNDSEFSKIKGGKGYCNGGHFVKTKIKKFVEVEE